MTTTRPKRTAATKSRIIEISDDDEGAFESGPTPEKKQRRTKVAVINPDNFDAPKEKTKRAPAKKKDENAVRKPRAKKGQPQQNENSAPNVEPENNDLDDICLIEDDADGQCLQREADAEAEQQDSFFEEAPPKMSTQKPQGRSSFWGKYLKPLFFVNQLNNCLTLSKTQSLDN